MESTKAIVVPPNTQNYYSVEEFRLKNPFTGREEIRRVESNREKRSRYGDLRGKPVIFIENPTNGETVHLVPCFRAHIEKDPILYAEGPTSDDVVRCLSAELFKDPEDPSIELNQVKVDETLSKLQVGGTSYVRIFDIDLSSRIQTWPMPVRTDSSSNEKKALETASQVVKVQRRGSKSGPRPDERKWSVATVTSASAQSGPTVTQTSSSAIQSGSSTTATQTSSSAIQSGSTVTQADFTPSQISSTSSQTSSTSSRRDSVRSSKDSEDMAVESGGITETDFYTKHGVTKPRLPERRDFFCNLL